MSFYNNDKTNNYWSQ